MDIRQQASTAYHLFRLHHRGAVSMTVTGYTNIINHLILGKDDGSVDLRTATMHYRHFGEEYIGWYWYGSLSWYVLVMLNHTPTRYMALVVLPNFTKLNYTNFTETDEILLRTML